MEQRLIDYAPAIAHRHGRLMLEIRKSGHF